MVAYNFQRRFVPRIERGDKRHTIRAPRKGRGVHAHPGGPVTLQTGPRFKPILLGRTTCLKVKSVRLDFSSGLIATRLRDAGGQETELWTEITTARGLERFAMADGFDSYNDMRQFWHDTHDAFYFEGVMIEWGFPFNV